MGVFLYIYTTPSTHPIHSYQLTITQISLFGNTLVSLPTGLENTNFIGRYVQLPPLVSNQLRHLLRPHPSPGWPVNRSLIHICIAISQWFSIRCNTSRMLTKKPSCTPVSLLTFFNIYQHIIVTTIISVQHICAVTLMINLGNYMSKVGHLR